MCLKIMIFQDFNKIIKYFFIELLWKNLLAYKLTLIWVDYLVGCFNILLSNIETKSTLNTIFRTIDEVSSKNFEY